MLPETGKLKKEPPALQADLDWEGEKAPRKKQKTTAWKRSIRVRLNLGSLQSSVSGQAVMDLGEERQELVPLPLSKETRVLVPALRLPLKAVLLCSLGQQSSGK